MNLGVAVREVRTALGLDLATVAHVATLDPPSLLRYESGEMEIPGEVVWRLSDILGIPFEDLESPIDLRRHLETLAIRFRTDDPSLSERVRLAVARAAVASRDFVELERLAGMPSRYERIAEEFPREPSLPRTQVWTAGRDLAGELRVALGLIGPIPSMIGLVDGLGVLVIWQSLPEDFAGYALCDEIHGPTVVLNVNGRNVNELVRRFTLAHELSHVLFDRRNLQRMTAFEKYDELYAYDDAVRDPRERRANAFAIHLLAPENDFMTDWSERCDIRHLMTKFGVSFEAVRYHLHNYRALPLTEEVSGIATTATDEWKNAESQELWYPGFDDIPIERRHALAKLAFRLWKDGHITSSRLRELLRSSLSRDRLRELLALYDESVAA